MESPYRSNATNLEMMSAQTKRDCRYLVYSHSVSTPLIATVTSAHLEFHHGVLAHLVPPGFGDVVDADQLGLVPHAVPLKPAQQVFIRLHRD